MLPGLSSAYAKGDTERYNTLLDRGLRLVMLVGIPAAVGLWLTSDALVSFLFQGRNFTPHDVSQTALAVVGYSVGLIGLIALKIVAPAFYARKDIRTPVKVAFWSLVVVQLVNLVSVPLFAHAGLALSVGIGSVFNAGTLLMILRRRGIYQPLSGWPKALLRVLVATAVMGVTLAYGQTFVTWTTMPWLMRSVGIGSVFNAGTLLMILRRRGIYQPLSGWPKALLRILVATAVMGATLAYGQTFVTWTTMPWLMRAGGVLGMVAAAAVIYFGLMLAMGWRLSDLRPGRGA